MRKTVFLVFTLLGVCVVLPAPATTWHVNGSVSESGDGTFLETAFKGIREGIETAGPLERVSAQSGASGRQGKAVLPFS